ncbi:MAG: FtsX-like permease family protein [Acidobacteria bacterium]|nr:FtsX-like permease family protein [Acidobacteriota bacterium]
MRVGEVLKSSYEALKANRVRTLLTALGLVIGNASVILVVTISLTSTEFILDQIRGIGSNVVWAYFETGSRESEQSEADFVKIADAEAIRNQLADRIVAVTATMSSSSTLVLEGKPQDTSVLGVDEYYPKVRNLILLTGRYFDASEVKQRAKVTLLTEPLAQLLYGSNQAAIGKLIKVKDHQFTVIGVFRERVQSFGLSELADRAMVVPITVVRYYIRVERIDPMYIQAKRAEDVEALTAEVKRILEGRHRRGAKYFVDNLGAILDTAKNISLILTFVLVLVAAIALVISGIGIMNIMLVTVTERTKEIGIRMAIGASRREVLAQFLMEAVLISTGGGLLGILVGVSGPLVAQYLVPEFGVAISPLSVIVAFVVSFAVGLIFGMLPANRASQLNPIEALRYE